VCGARIKINRSNRLALSCAQMLDHVCTMPVHRPNNLNGFHPPCHHCFYLAVSPPEIISARNFPEVHITHGQQGEKNFLRMGKICERRR
jgi:hypothetical protein